MLFLMEELHRLGGFFTPSFCCYGTAALVPNAGQDLLLLPLHSVPSAECHSTGKVQRWLSAVGFFCFFCFLPCPAPCYVPVTCDASKLFLEGKYFEYKSNNFCIL